MLVQTLTKIYNPSCRLATLRISHSASIKTRPGGTSAWRRCPATTTSSLVPAPSCEDRRKSSPTERSKRPPSIRPAKLLARPCQFLRLNELNGSTETCRCFPAFTAKECTIRLSRIEPKTVLSAL